MKRTDALDALEKAQAFVRVVADGSGADTSVVLSEVESLISRALEYFDDEDKGSEPEKPQT